MIQVKEVIVSDLMTRGTGSETSPIRRVIQCFELDGTPIAENDPNTFNDTDLLRFAIHCSDNKIYYPTMKDVYDWINHFDADAQQ